MEADSYEEREGNKRDTQKQIGNTGHYMYVQQLTDRAHYSILFIFLQLWWNCFTDAGNKCSSVILPACALFGCVEVLYALYRGQPAVGPVLLVLRQFVLLLIDHGQRPLKLHLVVLETGK